MNTNTGFCRSKLAQFVQMDGSIECLEKIQSLLKNIPSACVSSVASFNNDELVQKIIINREETIHLGVGGVLIVDGNDFSVVSRKDFNANCEVVNE